MPSTGSWTKTYLGIDVFEAAVNRMVPLYLAGHRVVISLSGGKDSGICLEICRIAARLTERLPVEVVMRDDEIMMPGTYDYVERVATDPEVSFTWLISHWCEQNIYNRAEPYYWAYDPDLDSSAYVRPIWPSAIETPWPFMNQMTTRMRFPPAPGKKLISVLGLRAYESLNRMRGTYATGGHLSPEYKGVINCKPIYDWSDRDIWLAIKTMGWDYNRAYDYMVALGISKNRQRIAPPVALQVSAPALLKFSRSFPAWFSRVEERLGPGLTQFRETGTGVGVFTARHKPTESWQRTFWRECVDEAPEWIAERASHHASFVVRRHDSHAVDAFPDEAQCLGCLERDGTSWRDLVARLYSGDREGYTSLPAIDPVAAFKPASPWAAELRRRRA